MLEAAPVGQDAIGLRKDRDQPGCGFEKGLLRVGPERGQRLQPFVRRTMLIELPLLRFRRDANFTASIAARSPPRNATVGGWPRWARSPPCAGNARSRPAGPVDRKNRARFGAGPLRRENSPRAPTIHCPPEFRAGATEQNSVWSRRNPTISRAQLRFAPELRNYRNVFRYDSRSAPGSVAVGPAFCCPPCAGR